VSSTTGADVISYTVSDGFGGSDTKFITNSVTASTNVSYNLILGFADNHNGTSSITYAGSRRRARTAW